MKLVKLEELNSKLKVDFNKLKSNLIDQVKLSADYLQLTRHCNFWQEVKPEKKLRIEWLQVKIEEMNDDYKKVY